MKFKTPTEKAHLKQIDWIEGKQAKTAGKTNNWLEFIKILTS